MIKKSIIIIFTLLNSLILLSSCAGNAQGELLSHLNSRPPAPGMPYENPVTLPDSVPDDLPFPFAAPPEGDLLGTVEDENHLSGTILLTAEQSAEAIVDYYTGLLSGSSFANAADIHNYHVFFPAEGSGATFCSGQAGAIFLEIFALEDGGKDVRLHYTTDKDIIGITTCGQPVLAIEDFPFPYLPAPPPASSDGGSKGGGGGGGGGTDTSGGPFGFIAEIEMTSDESLAWVHQYYQDLLAAEGWILIEQTETDESFQSSWDFGYYETRSWLARLIVSTGKAPNEYRVEFRAVSP
jgi:hypothetical protein